MTQSSNWQPSDIVDAGEETEPEGPRRRGRIPQSAWPHILERHRTGATLSAIAREFECTPSAISYILRRAEAAGVQPAPTPKEAAGIPPAPTPSVDASAPRQDGGPPPASAPAAVAAPRPAPSVPPAAAPAQGSLLSPNPGRSAAVPPGPGSIAARSQVANGTAGRGAANPGAISRGMANPGAASFAAASPGATSPGTSTPGTSTAGAAPPVRPAPLGGPPAERAGAVVRDAGQGAPTEPPRQPPARTEPPPIDEVESRLRDAARACLSTYRGWRHNPADVSLQTLGDAVHELRKVLARIEIEMSATRHDEQVARPMPIPQHRAQRGPRGPA